MRFVIIFSILFLLSNTVIATGEVRAIKTPEEATNRALNYLGFQKMDGFTRERNFDRASIVNITDDKTPFLHDKINNRDIWRVTFKDITLLPYRGYPDSVDYPRTFDVYIDPADGTLLKIESLYAGNNIDFAPEPSIEWAESQMQGTMFVFQGFVSPDSNYVSFYDILNSLGPPNFKQLKALLINTGRNINFPYAVWYVIYRGIPPYLPKGKAADLSKKEAYNYRSYIYDAKTGQLSAMTNQPSIEFDKLE